VNEQRLRDELRRVPVDDGARARALRVARAAARETRPARRRWMPAVALATCALLAVALASAVTGPGDALARWVRDVLGADQPKARPALVHVPGGGRLLVNGAGGTWVVAPDGSRRRIGAYAGASWSPNGRFVVAWRDGELLAVEPGGRVRWSLARPERITAARWNAVDGFRIAYVTGRSLRVVGGDGAGDRRLGTAGGAALAWRPDDDHVLAYVDGLRRPTVEAVDSGRVLWSGDPLGDGPVELAWSPDGRRLLVATARAWLVVGRDGRERGWQPVREGFAVDDVAWAPRGDRFVVVRRNERRSDITLVGPRSRRLLFTGAGRFGPVAFSPDGRRLLVPSPGADQWLFLETGAAGGVTAVANIGRQFARGPGRAAFPDAVEWSP